MYSLIKSSLILLLAVGLSNCDEYICPAPTDIYPCTCSSNSLGLEVLCDGDKNDVSIEALQNSLKHLSGMKINYLELSSVNMSQAPLELFHGLVMEELFLRGTVLQEMPVFQDSENTLKELTLRNAISERSIQNFKLKETHLNKLKSITVTYNFFSGGNLLSFSNDWFHNSLSSLEKVDLNANLAESFGDQVFSKLLNMKEIDLSHNSIYKVHRSMFPDPARHLFSINLGNNDISSLPEDIFTNMHVLQKVDISFNFLETLDEHTWTPVWEQLDYLSFKGTAISCDSRIIWTFDLSRPTYLDAKCEGTYDGHSLRYLRDIIDEKQSQSRRSNTN